jgi:hypothetical protein
VPFALPLVVLLAAKAPPGPAKPLAAAACPSEARVEVNLPAWRASLEQADTEARRDELLAEVKLALDLPEPETPEARAPRLARADVEDTAVPLEPDGRADHVLQIRYRLAGVEDAPTIHLVQVLRPLGGRAYCALGAELSRREEPPAKLVSYALTFVPLVSARAKVIQVESVVGEARRSETRRAYFVARGMKLEKIFDEALGHMTSGDGPTTTTVGTLKLAGDFPKRIELTETKKEATARGGCEVGAGDNTPCEGGGADTETTTFVYDGARYVRKK